MLATQGLATYYHFRMQDSKINFKGVKILALMEKMLLMRSRFYEPQEIRNMFAAQGISAHIETDGKYTAWIIADKI